MENTQGGLLPRQDKVYFIAGDIVELKHDIENRPRMVITSVDKTTLRDNDKSALLGVTCMWFSVDQKIQKERFSTKDIRKFIPKKDD